MASNPRSRAQWGFLGLAVVGAIVVAASWFTESPSGAIEALLRELAAAVSAPPGDSPSERRSRIKGALARYVAQDARLRVEELPGVTHPGEPLVDALMGIVQVGEQASVELTHIEVDNRGGVATAVVDARLAADTGRALHAPHRQLTLRLSKRRHGWQIVDAEVPAETLPEPEARP